MDNSSLKKIVKLAFPDYKGRKIALATGTLPTQLDSYWDSGCRDYWAFVRLYDHKVLPVHSNHPGFEARQPRTLRSLPVGFALVCRSYSGCAPQRVTVWEGKDNDYNGQAVPQLG